jgi:hypothetical protein
MRRDGIYPSLSSWPTYNGYIVADPHPFHSFFQELNLHHNRPTSGNWAASRRFHRCTIRSSKGGRGRGRGGLGGGRDAMVHAVKPCGFGACLARGENLRGTPCFRPPAPSSFSDPDIPSFVFLNAPNSSNPPAALNERVDRYHVSHRRPPSKKKKHPPDRGSEFCMRPSQPHSRQGSVTITCSPGSPIIRFRLTTYIAVYSKPSKNLYTCM